MAYLKTVTHDNAGTDFCIRFYSCDSCGCEISEAHPRYYDDDCDFCWKCAFINNKISDKEYLKHCGIYLNNMRAIVHEGKIFHLYGKQKPPWELTDKDKRNTTQYKGWRTSVFVRDKYTCQHCGQVGGTLNAHHIRPFKKYKKLRYKVDNGLTLCEKCHRNVHSKRSVTAIE